MSAPLLTILGILIPALACHLLRTRENRAFGTELAALLDDAAIDELSAQVRSAPVAVLGSTGHDWRGCFLRVERAGVSFRLRLYRPVPAGARLQSRAPVHLTALRYINGLGWRIDVRDANGARRHLGWFLEVETHHRVVRSPSGQR